jgi:hypothetical protein
VNDPDAPSLSTTPAAYERWTRRLGRLGAVLVVASLLMPQLWFDTTALQDISPITDGRIHVHWIWEGRPDVTTTWPDTAWWLEGPLSPSGACLLLVSVLAWVAAGFRPLVRRGPWLIVPLLLCLAWSSPTGSSLGLLPRGLGAHFTWLVVAVLGLFLSGTAAHRRLGSGFCVVGGLLLLGVFLWPTETWTWPVVEATFGGEIAGPAEHLFVVLFLGALLLAGLLLWIGLARERGRGARRLAITGLVALLTLAYVPMGMELYQSAPQQDVPHLFVAIWNPLRLQLRLYAEALLLVVGGVAWIVGARAERAAESVFD